MFSLAVCVLVYLKYLICIKSSGLKFVKLTYEWSNTGVDGVGTVSASLVTYASVQALKPDLIINAGTAGGFGV